MSYVCEKCGKKNVAGVSRSHRRGVAGKRWNKRAQETKRTFVANLQKYHSQLLCTSCIKKLKIKR